MPLAFVGLGLTADSLTLDAFETLRQADRIYLERYTSPVTKETIQKLRKRLRRPVWPASRTFVEDGRALLEAAKTQTVALLSPGDSFMATTHQELKTRAHQQHISTYTFHNASVLTALPGETGLHAYKFGRPVTVTRNPTAPLTTVYHTILENLQRNLHTIMLLEYDQTTNYFLSPKTAIQALLDTEATYHQNVFMTETFLIVTSRVASPDQALSAGHAQTLLKLDPGRPPHSIVLPASLHFSEKEAVKAILGVEEDDLRDNTGSLKKLSGLMVARYAEETRKALASSRKRAKKQRLTNLHDLFENVEAYTADAERFLNEGKDELAVLSIGYAEGLLDALNYTKLLAVEW